MPPAALLFLLLNSFAAGEDDVTCLRNFKSSVSDPDGHLLSWNFSNSSAGFICNFSGVTCWNPHENRVISLSLPSSSLAGHLPSALRLCSSVSTLDLSFNSLSGPIPPDLCTWLPYLVSLDLSGNSLTGPIPSNLSDCKFLNKLRLASNSLSGPIPSSLPALVRLEDLDLSGNDLSGEIPLPLSKFNSSSFAGNPNLYGNPVSSACHRSVTKTARVIIIAAVFGGVFGASISLVVAYKIYRDKLTI